MSTQQHNQHYDATIRAVEPEDFIAVKRIYEQPGAYYGTLQMPFPSAELWKKRLENPANDSYVLVACVDEQPVGSIGLMLNTNPRRRHTGHLGMGVHDDYVGRGVGQLMMDSVLDIADNWLNISRIELTVYADNERAINLYQRSGFESEGTLRHYAFRQGQYVDALTMARFKV